MFENIKTNLFDFLYLYKLWLHFHILCVYIYLFNKYLFIYLMYYMYTMVQVPTASSKSWEENCTVSVQNEFHEENSCTHVCVQNEFHESMAYRMAWCTGPPPFNWSFYYSSWCVSFQSTFDRGSYPKLLGPTPTMPMQWNFCRWHKWNCNPNNMVRTNSNSQDRLFHENYECHNC